MCGNDVGRGGNTQCFTAGNASTCAEVSPLATLHTRELRFSNVADSSRVAVSSRDKARRAPSSAVAWLALRGLPAGAAAYEPCAISLCRGVVGCSGQPHRALTPLSRQWQS